MSNTAVIGSSFVNCIQIEMPFGGQTVWVQGIMCLVEVLNGTMWQIGLNDLLAV